MRGLLVGPVLMLVGALFLLWSGEHNRLEAAMAAAETRNARINAECIRLGGHISHNQAMCLTPDNRILDFPLDRFNQ